MTLQRMMGMAICLGMLITGSVCGAESQDSPTWISADGRFTVQATIVGHEDKHVTLRRDDDGREIRVPVSALGHRDRQYVARWIRQDRADAGPSDPAPGSENSAAPATGEFDWPRWRGVRLDGKSTERGLLASWPDQGPPLAWQVEGLGTGFASVSVANGKIHIMGRLNADRTELLPWMASLPMRSRSRAI